MTTDSDRPLKILLAGDASNYHQALASGLKHFGHDVTVASNGSNWMKTERGIDLSRRLPGKLGGLELWLRFNSAIKWKLRGFDIVSIATTGFIYLRPERQRKAYDWLRQNNKSMFYTALGTDSNYVAECLDPNSPMKYNEFKVFGEDSPFLKSTPDILDRWLDPKLSDYCRHTLSTVDGAVSVLWEYDLALHRALPPEKIAYGGLPIETDKLKPIDYPQNINKVRIFLGRDKYRKVMKGTDLFEAAAREVVSRHPDKAELILVENRPYAEYLELLKSAHVVLDQVYSYTPATNALLAMAYGIPAVSGAEPEFLDFIGEKDCPVFNAPTGYNELLKLLTHIVTHPQELSGRSVASRKFVEKHHDCRTVAHRYLDFWTERLRCK